MKEKSTIHGSSLEKVVDLLNIGTDLAADLDKPDQDRSDMLNDMLNEPLALYADKSSRKSAPLSHTIAVLADEPIGKLLLDPKADLASIRMIKNHGRIMADQAKIEGEHQAANVIYYAAIAHALVFQNEKITKFSYDDLKKAFKRLAQEDWINKGMLDIFVKACEYCEDKLE